MILCCKNERRCGNILAQKTYTPDYLTHKSVANKNKLPQYYAVEQHEAIVSPTDFLIAQRMLRASHPGWQYGLPALQVHRDGMLGGFVTAVPQWTGFGSEDYNRASLNAYGVPEERLEEIAGKIEQQEQRALLHMQEELRKQASWDDDFVLFADDEEQHPEEQEEPKESFYARVKSMGAKLVSAVKKEAISRYDLSDCELVRPQLFSLSEKAYFTLDRKGIQFNRNCAKKMYPDGKAASCLVEVCYNPVERILVVCPADKESTTTLRWYSEQHPGKVTMRRCGCRGLAQELLFRKPIAVNNEKTAAYYRDKVILITGGGGSIGSELCRQLAKMGPKQIIILDIYENGAYDIQQELKIAYGDKLDLQIEICSITHRQSLERVFETYRPQIVINAAAHKHVPLMEKNCIEAVYNNVFGTWNLVNLCEKYHTERFMMVSTDKAVNPTNVMGATKRMCEMIVQSASVWGSTKYSATRFGNVLGSAGSVIPLFKRQIASGGPITLTDKRIIRYFMTIPEASQLVLESGAMAKNGELFVLDMGQPVRILDLAESMIRLSGASGIEIVETGLRPGEKLYEELLAKTETLTTTENSLIFIEKDTPLSKAELERRLEILKKAVDTGSNEVVRRALKQVVPTYRSPEEVNANAEQAAEMKMQQEPVGV